MIYFRLYIEDFDGATLDLSMLEDGAYNRLMRYYYRTEQPLPSDSDRLARVCRAISLEERAAIAAVLDRFFIQLPDGWHNERADHEIAVSQTARSNGSRGGRPNVPETEQQTGSITGSVTGSETGTQTGVGGGSAQPFSRLTKTTQIPKTTPLPSQPEPLSADAPRRGAAKPAALTAETWGAYSAAYRTRYGEEPVRNQRVNGQLASVVRSLGADEAPGVAAFYVLHNRADYVKALHPASLLARDAESLRTAWAAGRVVTDAEARQVDRTQATGAVFTKLLEDAR